MSIARRPDGRWRARYRDVAGKEHARHFVRKLDAQRWLNEVTASVVTGAYVAPRAGRITVGAWAAKWQHDHTGHLKPSTALRYEGLLRLQVLPTWETVQLESVRHADVGAWVASLSAAGLSPSSVRAAHRVLSLLLDLAVRDRRIASNPAVGVKLPRAVSREVRALTRAQVADLATAAGADGDVVRLLATSGLRFGEMVGLKVARVDLLRRRLDVAEAVTQVGGVLTTGTPKTHQRRTVPLARSLVKPLALRCAGRDSDDYVFTSPQGGPIRLDNWRRRVFDPAVLTAGLADVTPHDLRHTAASLAISSGASIKAVQRMLGHASAAMTLDRHGHLYGDDLDDLADRLDGPGVDGAADQVRTVAPVVPLVRASTGTGSAPVLA